MKRKMNWRNLKFLPAGGDESQAITRKDKGFMHLCELLRDLSVIHNKTIVMVTHEPTVAAYAQEVAVLKDGKLVKRFATEEAGGGEGLAVRYQESLR